MAVSGLTTESVTRLERKRARNRDALLASARVLFTRDGFEETTIAAIAEEADLGFGTFYRYFTDKEAALAAVLADAGLEMDEVVLAGDDLSRPAAESLTNLIHRFIEVGSRNRDVFALWWQLTIKRGERPEPPEGPGPSLPVKLGEAIRGIITRGVAAGEFDETDPFFASYFITSGLLFVLGPYRPNEHDDAAFAAHTAELALRSLGAAIPQAPATGTSRRRGR